MMRSVVDAAVRARLVLGVGVVLSVSCLAMPVARGATTIDSYGYLPGATFGSAGTAASPQHTGVAVGQSTGNVFLAEQVIQRVSVYTPDASAGGTSLATVSTPTSFPQDVAVDPTDGSLFVAANSFFGTALEKYVSDGAPTPTYTADPAFVPSLLSPAPVGVAVDPVSHDLLVADAGTGRIERLSAADGSSISSFDGSDSAGGAFQNLGAVAVGPTGTIYVVDGGSRVERFSSAGVSLGALAVGSGSDVAGVTVQPLSGDVVVAINRQGQTYLKGFASGGAELFLSRFPSSREVRGLAWDGGSDRIYVATDGGGAAITFVPADQPGVDAPVVSAITGTGAHLSAEVAGAAGPSTAARFEYCPATASCGDYPISNPGDPGNPWVRLADHSVTGTETIEDDLPVTPSNSWRVRVSADSTYASGVVTDNTSSTVSFDSPLAAPNVQTGAAGSITTSTAELTGTIDTYGGQTTYHFEYGLTPAYGSRVPADAEAAAGQSRTPRVVSRPISGLQPGTTYHFRLVARNAAGVTEGPDRTFVTAAAEPLARGYEQVTPVNKKGGVINSLLGFQAADDGSAVSYTLASPPTDAPSAVIFTRYLSRRDKDDWLNWSPTDPPLNVARNTIEVVTQAISSDFTHALVVSNRALTAGAIDGGANIYVVDLRTQDYTLVGAAPGYSAYSVMAGLQTENLFLAGAPDFSWVVINSPRSLLGANAPPAALYRWSRTGPSTGALSLQSSPAASIERPSGLLSRYVSDDGTIMYYDNTDGDGAVYRQDLNGATTPVSVVQAGAPSAGTVAAAFLNGVSRNGRYAIITTQQRLTADNPPSLNFFYMYRVDTQTGDVEFIGQPANGATAVYMVSDDANTVFFHTDTGGSRSWRNGVTHAFTTSELDHPVGRGVQVFASPNGRYLAYVDSGNLTGSLHLYDAEAQTDVCVSCPIDGSSVGRDFGLPSGSRTVSNRAPLVVNNDGLMFFDTAARLLSADHNGSQDVYSYQDGKLSLMSPGEGNFTARFADATPDGTNMYFTTDEPLVGQDTDESLDLYDLRVGGGFPGQSPPAKGGCARNDCREPSRGPVDSPSPGVSPPQSSDQEGPEPPKSSVGIKVSKVTVGSRSVRVSFRASQRGRVQVSGTRVVKSVRNVAKAGTYSITVPLTRRARQLHAAHRRFTLSVKVTLTGGWGSASAKFSRTLGK